MANTVRVPYPNVQNIPSPLAPITIGLNSGSSPAPSLYFQAESTLGWYRPAAGVIQSTGRFKLPTANYAYPLDIGQENLADLWLPGQTQQPRRVAISDGSSSVYTDGDAKSTFVAQRWYRTNGLSGTIVPFLFQSVVDGGSATANYGLASYAYSAATTPAGGFDLVALAGVARSENPGVAQVRGVYAEARMSSTSPTAEAIGVEVGVGNETGLTAPAWNGLSAGKTIGVVINSGIGGAGSVRCTAALLVNTGGGGVNDKFVSGIIFAANSIHNLAIDCSLLGSSVTPLLLSNNSYVYANNVAASASKPLLGVGGDDTTRVAGDTIIFQKWDLSTEQGRFDSSGNFTPHGLVVGTVVGVQVRNYAANPNGVLTGSAGQVVLDLTSATKKIYVCTTGTTWISATIS